MQIVIPMSGFGERFRRAGYTVPKPLIPLEGKPIIAHVVDLFPGETDILFICNQEHLDEPAYAMEAQLRRLAPKGRVVGISPHRRGPVWAVLQAREFIKPDRPTFVNYCDYACYWDWADFTSFVAETGCAGAIPAYRGFHPHSLGTTYYAYIREQNGWLEDIQEKQPFTDRPMGEYTSSGGYYFRSGALCLETFQATIDQDLNVDGEYYASLAYKVLAQRKAPVAIYELQHFMQWGSPQDLKEYVGWSDVFRRLAIDDARRGRQSGSVLVPMAGYGKRFADAGYAQQKPLISVSGRPMVIQATRDLPDAPVTRFVLRRDLPSLDEILRKLRTSFVGVSALVLDKGTDGQAVTCQRGLADLDLEAPLTIGACDNGMLYEPQRFEALMEPGGPDVLVWVVRGHANGRLRPEMFGWVEADAAGRITGVRVKQAPDDPEAAPMIVGAFTFRRGADFDRACARLLARNGRVNGEFYVDSLLEDALALRLDCRLFEIDHYLGWGTPNDLETFEYWQSCFHKWPAHPYRLEKDRRVPSSQAPVLAERFRAIVPTRPNLTPPGAGERRLRDEITAASTGTSRRRPRILGAPFFPDHAANKMRHEGDVEGARARFVANKPNNLRFLLEKRFAWMNQYVQPGVKALELGCGAGFAEFFIEAPIIFSDVEPRPWVARIVDALKLDELGETYDVVICSHMIHHVSQPIKFFADLGRIVRPGGCVLINEIHTGLLMRVLLRMMRHEGWSYDVDVFDREAIANDPRDPWSANCAIPQLLFRDRTAFEAAATSFRVERYELNECLIFPLSGGVIARANTVNLPNALLRIVERVDQYLIKFSPDVFAMGGRAVLRRHA
ncbi:MAG: NTP transferase domain-containing protein [Pseudomonadota bacterium]|nr:NTP transferase domain-containing protein [Pseudomonadota bacterium]